MDEYTDDVTEVDEKIMVGKFIPLNQLDRGSMVVCLIDNQYVMVYYQSTRWIIK